MNLQSRESFFLPTAFTGVSVHCSSSGWRRPHSSRLVYCFFFIVRISWRSFSRRARPWVWQERRSLVEPPPRRRGRWRDPVNKMPHQQTEAPQTMWVPVPCARLPSHRHTPSHTTVSLVRGRYLHSSQCYGIIIHHTGWNIWHSLF